MFTNPMLDIMFSGKTLGEGKFRSASGGSCCPTHPYSLREGANRSLGIEFAGKTDRVSAIPGLRRSGIPAWGDLPEFLKPERVGCRLMNKWQFGWGLVLLRVRWPF